MKKFKKEIDEKLDRGVVKNIEGLIFVETCDVCPEQYAVFTKSGYQVGYVRLRYGHLRCDYLDCMKGPAIYHYNFNSDEGFKGAFYDEEERRYYLTEIAKRIKKYDSLFHRLRYNNPLNHLIIKHKVRDFNRELRKIVDELKAQK